MILVLNCWRSRLDELKLSRFGQLLESFDGPFAVFIDNLPQRKDWPRMFPLAKIRLAPVLVLFLFCVPVRALEVSEPIARCHEIIKTAAAKPADQKTEQKSEKQSQVKPKKSPTQDNKATDNNGYDPSVPKPTLVNIPYGPHPRNTLDFWKAKSDRPTALVFLIHGGGWRGGSSQEKMHKLIDTAKILKSGISVVSINYRLMKHAQEVQPPVKAPLEDAARALQFVRTKAAEWNFDKNKIGASGGSAGGCSALWIAYHSDFVKVDSDDPVERESSRPNLVAVNRPQTTLDPVQMRQWITNVNYGAHAFKLDDFDTFLAARDRLEPWIKAYSPYEHLSKDDPPTYMYFTIAPSADRIEKDATHSAIFGVELKKRCDELGVPCEVVYPRAPNVQHKTPTDYLIDKLK